MGRTNARTRTKYVLTRTDGDGTAVSSVHSSLRKARARVQEAARDEAEELHGGFALSRDGLAATVDHAGGTVTYRALRFTEDSAGGGHDADPGSGTTMKGGGGTDRGGDRPAPSPLMDVAEDGGTSAELRASDPEGTLGTLRGRKAVRVDLDGTPYAVAWANEGATRPEDAGDRMSFREALHRFCRGVQDCRRARTWRLPTKAELQAIDRLPGFQSVSDGVAGRCYVAGGRAVFLPAAGVAHHGEVYDEGDVGCYWSSTLVTTYMPALLRFDGEGHGTEETYSDELKMSIRLVLRMADD